MKTGTTKNGTKYIIDMDQKWVQIVRDVKNGKWITKKTASHIAKGQKLDVAMPRKLALFHVANVTLNFEEGFQANVDVCQFDGTIMAIYGLDEEAARFMFGFLPDEKGFDWNKEIYQRENIISDPGDISCPNAPRDATAPTIDGLAIVVCPKCGHSVLFSFEHD